MISNDSVPLRGTWYRDQRNLIDIMVFCVTEEMLEQTVVQTCWNKLFVFLSVCLSVYCTLFSGHTASVCSNEVSIYPVLSQVAGTCTQASVYFG